MVATQSANTDSSLQVFTPFVTRFDPQTETMISSPLYGMDPQSGQRVQRLLVIDSSSRGQDNRKRAVTALYQRTEGRINVLLAERADELRRSEPRQGPLDSYAKQIRTQLITIGNLGRGFSYLRGKANNLMDRAYGALSPPAPVASA